jgi:hypothetical protein
MNLVLGVGAALGIRTDYAEQDVRVYVAQHTDGS